MIVRSLIAASLMISSMASAQTAPPSPANGKPAANTQDPSEKICQNITVTGSRIATKRFCGTRAEWAERKQQDRDALDAAQRSPCVRDGLTCK